MSSMRSGNGPASITGSTPSGVAAWLLWWLENLLPVTA